MVKWYSRHVSINRIPLSFLISSFPYGRIVIHCIYSNTYYLLSLYVHSNFHQLFIYLQVILYVFSPFFLFILLLLYLQPAILRQTIIVFRVFFSLADLFRCFPLDTWHIYAMHCPGVTTSTWKQDFFEGLNKLQTFLRVLLQQSSPALLPPRSRLYHSTLIVLPKILLFMLTINRK